MIEEDGFEGLVAVVSADACDFFDDIKTVDDFSENGMSIIEVRGRDFSDEEL